MKTLPWCSGVRPVPPKINTPLAEVNVPACGAAISEGMKSAVMLARLMGKTVASACTFETSWTLSLNDRCGLRASCAGSSMICITGCRLEQKKRRPNASNVRPN